MAHIHTDKDNHDFSVTAYIVRTDGAEPKALLHMHKKLKVLLPVGGHVELSETPWQAMAHEIEEEAGYTLEQLVLLQPKSRIKRMTKVVQHPYPVAMNTHSIPDNHYHSDIAYALLAKSDPLVELQDGESLDIRWLSSSELDALPDDLMLDNTREVYRFVLDEALNNWDRVPTSEFLLTFPEEYR